MSKSKTPSAKTRKLVKRMAKEHFRNPLDDVHFLLDFHALSRKNKITSDDLITLFKGDKRLVHSLFNDYDSTPEDFDNDIIVQGFWRGLGKLVGYAVKGAIVAVGAALGKKLIPSPPD